MSTWVVQLVVVVLFAVTCGVLAAGWTRGRLGLVAVGVFVVALVAWIAAFVAIANELGDASRFATCGAECTPVHYVSAIAFLAPPLLIALSALAMLVARGSRWRTRRAAGRENHAS